MIKETELILNADGSIYHLGLTPDQMCEHVILVGDPERILLFEKHFDRVYFTQQRREFNTMMGEISGKNVLIVSTGIGTDNIDIVINELDALLNVDFKTRKVKSKPKKINFLRLGTSGTLKQEIPIDSFIVSKYAIGLDSLMQFYTRNSSEATILFETEIKKFLRKSKIDASCYVENADEKLLKKAKIRQGITVTLPGFYGPQARMLRGEIKSKQFLDQLAQLSLGDVSVTNLEMETAGIYGLSNLLGHRALSISVILANRKTGEFSKNPYKAIEHLVQYGMELITKL